MRRKKLAVNGEIFEVFIIKSHNGYKLSAVIKDKHPYKIIREKIFINNPTKKQIQRWAVNALQTIKN